MAATFAVIPVLVIFGVVIGGIYAGIYNPTPAAAIGVGAGVACSASIMRRLTWRDTIEALLETARHPAA